MVMGRIDIVCVEGGKKGVFAVVYSMEDGSEI